MSRKADFMFLKDSLHQSQTGYGFININELPYRGFSEEKLPVDGIDWATTGEFSAAAKRHCGAVCATNIALFFAASGCAPLKKEGSKERTFEAVHKIIRNGPVIKIAGGVKKYFSQCGFTLACHSVRNDFEKVKAATAKGRPCGILLARSLCDWHWVLCVGWREYDSGGQYLRIIDGWNNTADKFYHVNEGSRFVAGTEYYNKPFV